MKIDSIGHAAILIETKGLRILSDPWWAGPCFESQGWLYPKENLAPVEAVAPDYIYISHGHVDHLHNGTLSRLPKPAKCLVSSTIDMSASGSRSGNWTPASAPSPPSPPSSPPDDPAAVPLLSADPPGQIRTSKNQTTSLRLVTTSSTGG